MTVEGNGNITYTCPADDNKVKIYTKKDNRYHYCVVVKKVDENTGAALEGAVFNATNAIGPVVDVANAIKNTALKIKIILTRFSLIPSVVANSSPNSST